MSSLSLLLLLQTELFLILGLWCHRRLFFHARRFEHIGPLSTGAAVAMLEMLPEMIGTEELLALVAFTEFVHGGQMLAP